MEGLLLIKLEKQDFIQINYEAKKWKEVFKTKK